MATNLATASAAARNHTAAPLGRQPGELSRLGVVKTQANTAYCLGVNDSYLLGLLNSKLFWFAISQISIPFGARAGKFRYRLIYQYMERVPVRVIDTKDRANAAKKAEIAKLAAHVLGLCAQARASRIPQSKTALERQVLATSEKIDRLIYQVYGLTKADIDIVESCAQTEALNEVPA